MNIQNPLIHISNMHFFYEHLQVLEQINLDVNAGEFLGIVGPNAGGKSTLLKLILGVLQPQIGFLEVLSKPAGDMTHKIGYVPQYPTFTRDFPITVAQLILLGRVGYKGGLSALLPQRTSVQDHEAVQAALAEVEAESLYFHRLSTLSGGQLQRVLLARALVSKPDILLLDEPTSNIDMRLEGEIFDLLKQLNERMTILVVSHDVAFVSAYVTRVACINRTLVCHETSKIDGNVIHDLYGGDVRMVAHNH